MGDCRYGNDDSRPVGGFWRYSGRITLVFQLSAKNKRGEALWAGRVGGHPVSLRFRLSSDVSTATWIAYLGRRPGPLRRCLRCCGRGRRRRRSTPEFVFLSLFLFLYATQHRFPWFDAGDTKDTVIVTSFEANFDRGGLWWNAVIIALSRQRTVMDTRRRHRRSSQRGASSPDPPTNPEGAPALRRRGLSALCRSFCKYGCFNETSPRHGAPYCFLPTACPALNRHIARDFTFDSVPILILSNRNFSLNFYFDIKVNQILF